MNKAVRYLFLILFPFYPIWAWISTVYLKKPIDFFAGLVMLPLALYFVVTAVRKLPAYLLWFMAFTAYHLVSVYVNELVPKDSNWVYFFLTDNNVLACLFFLVIEYTDFDDAFIRIMNRNILIVIVLSLAVTLVQIKNPAFFFNPEADPELQYVGEGRSFSIYSWINLNSSGVTFPFLIAIAISLYDTKMILSVLIVVCGIAVSFLTKARYVMISAIIVLSQLFFDPKRSIVKRASLVALLVGGVLFFGLTAKYIGVDVEDTINTRILEKGSDMASAKARVLSYDVFFKVFPQHPFLGVGPATRQDVVDMLGGEAPLIHVGYLSYFYFYGVIGFSFLLISLFCLLRWAWQVGRQTNFWASFYGLFAFALANASFVYFNFSEMGIVLAVIYLKYFSQVQQIHASAQEEQSAVYVTDDLSVSYE